MKKDLLLRQLAELGYNVGFGAKKHFATYDIVTKVPGAIGLLSIAVGVFALFVETLSGKYVSATFIVLGFSTLMINFYDDKKDVYERAGKNLTQLFNDLRTLYDAVKSSDQEDLSTEIEQLKAIEDKYYSECITKHIFLCDWYAHYKFFWQHQISWIDDELHFTFWRDKLPLSFVLCCSVLIVACIGGVAWAYFGGLLCPQ